MTASEIHAAHVAHVKSKNAKVISATANEATKTMDDPAASTISDQDVIANIASIVELIAQLADSMEKKPVQPVVKPVISNPVQVPVNE